MYLPTLILIGNLNRVWIKRLSTSMLTAYPLKYLSYNKNAKYAISHCVSAYNCTFKFIFKFYTFEYFTQIFVIYIFKIYVKYFLVYGTPRTQHHKVVQAYTQALSPCHSSSSSIWLDRDVQ